MLRKLVLALLFIVLPAQYAFSYSIITDSNLFYSFFTRPQKIIDFAKLKDGTSVAQASDNLQLNTRDRAKLDCLNGSGDDSSWGKTTVRPSAFSDDWLFMAATSTRSDSFCRAVIWFDQGISSGHSKIAIVAASGKSKPFVLYTNKGFLGIIPDNSNETVFILDGFSTVFGFETEFTKASSVSDSEESYVAKLLAPK
jgi:hypothetical protein